MQISSDPKYDTDVVNLRYLNKVLENKEKETDDKLDKLNKNYGSEPTPPYEKGDTYTIDKKIYKCIKSRDIGSFNISDWELIVDGDELQDFISGIYTIDKINLESQLDSKIETYIQDEDPSLEWTTDIEKERHKGDYWRKTSSNGHREFCYTKMGTNPVSYKWIETDAPAPIYDLIDGKKAIYTSKPSSYSKDDMWIIENSLLEEELPKGVKHGDWVFATEESDTYNKLHWIKRDEKVDIQYIEENYYKVTEIDNKFTEISRDTDSKITKAKDDIALSVSQTYTTKEETTSAVNRISNVEENIGTITETVTTQGETLAQLNVSNGEIKATVSETVESVSNIKNDLNNVYTKEQVNAGVNTNTENINQLREQMTQLQQLADSLSITITNINQNGVSKVVTSTGFVFDENGLNISKAGEAMSAIFDNQGFVVKNYDTEMLVARGNQVITENLTVRKYLVTGRHRFEKFTDEKNRPCTGLFWVGDN